jgi:DNA invertase Pin-like site-specific DNA recombinase
LSIRSQQDRFQKWCESNDVTVVGVVSDHDLRGNNAERPGLDELRRRIVDDRVDTLWLLSLSRLARDIVLHFSLIREFQKLGITRIHSETEGEIADEFFHGILALMHQKSRVEMSAHLRGAFARRARDGGFPTGMTPVGYQRPHSITIHRANGTSYERRTGQPVVDPDGAAFVRSLYDRYLSGDSLTTIAHDLRAQGPGVRGGTWVPRTVQQMLKSPIYVGDIAYQGDVVAHNNDWQIVDRDTWNRVQERLASRVVVHGDKREPHPFEGLIEHECGMRMYWQPDSRGGGSFICRGQFEQTCELPRRVIGGSLLVNAIRAALVQDLGQRRTPVSAHQRAVEASGGRDAVKHRAQLDKRHHDAQARWDRSYERFAAGKLPPGLMDDEDARLAAELESIARDREAAPATPDMASLERTAAMLDTVAEHIAAATPAELAGLLRDLGTVTVSDAGVRVVYAPHVRHLIDGAVVPVPLWGKGLR